MTRTVFALLVLALLALWALLAFPIWAVAEHRPSLAWMAPFRGKDGSSCCSTLDCVETTVALLSLDTTQSVALVSDTVVSLPHAWVHPSQDGRGYWCYVAATQPRYRDPDGVERTVPPATPTVDNTRCVFYRSSN